MLTAVNIYMDLVHFIVALSHFFHRGMQIMCFVFMH